MEVPLTAREIRLLDFNAIREQLANYTVTARGEEMAGELLPCADLPEIQYSLEMTAQASRLLDDNLFTLSRVPDLQRYIERLEKGGTLGGEELGKIIQFLRGCSHLLKISAKEAVQEVAPQIGELMGELRPCSELLRSLENCLNEEGEIFDDATSLLKNLRRQKFALQRDIREKLDHYLKSASYRKYLQEPLVTVRNNRYVIPVKQEYRNQVSGVTHDQSSSGATIFVEPLPVVEMQNRLQQTERQEQKEVERLLQELSYRAARYCEELSVNEGIYGSIDLQMAKGQYKLATASVEPEITDEKVLELKRARHPLLEDPVPVDVEIGESCQVLVITGPNTGGKTVTLKTMGLMAVMAQSGLHLPVSIGSRMGVFKGIYADIGDEQSLEQSLSTFSGHLKNIIEILEVANDRTLVLLDELGAGTDPSEGAALARGILLDLYHRGCLVASTTHINELKLFAQVEEGIQNASMEFDQDTLSPTYRLLQGVPGKSNALAIAEKLGLDPSILEQAQEFLAGGHQEVEEMIGSLTQEQQKLRADSQAAAQERYRMEKLHQELKEERKELKQKREEMLKEARQEARSVVKRAKKSADESLLELQKLQEEMKNQQASSSQVLSRGEEVRRELKEELESTAAELSGDYYEESEEAELEETDLKKGNPVWIISLGQKGIVLNYHPDEEELQVQVGALKVNTQVKDVKPLGKTSSDRENEVVKKSGYSFRRESANVKSEINLRGLTLPEAVEIVDKYIDDALVSGLNEVTLVHGKGTGTLRRGIHEFLQNRAWVEECRLGDASEGGSGVTVVKLRRDDQQEEESSGA